MCAGERASLGGRVQGLVSHWPGLFLRTLVVFSKHCQDCASFWGVKINGFVMEAVSAIACF